ncbi:2-oxo acid dehydrogenase subunit E2 [Streptomyces sp. NPDC050803]|uniref:2-oxo acid dehydrogenase subunit E2 n=1 Tax=unclassified Streptomyces TaxID=2593676 RepID=UPI0034157DFC
MAEFTMPSLGADMDEGLLVEWLVHSGDKVSKGDVVAVVETDKAAIEVECFESGTVGKLLVEPGTRVPVGAPLAVIESGTSAAREGGGPAGRTAEATPTREPAEAERDREPAEAERGREVAEAARLGEAGESVPVREAAADVGAGEAARVGEVVEAVRDRAAVEAGESVPVREAAAGARAVAGAEPGKGAVERAVPAAAEPVVAALRQEGSAGSAPADERPEPPQEPVRARGRRKPTAEEPVRARGRRKPAREPGPAPVVPATTAPPELAAEAKPVAAVGPLVRHLAAERGVDLGTVHGTGRGGRITRADVEHAPPAPRPRPRVTPYARRLARELGVDLAEVRGSGEGGAVRAADVHAAVRERSRPGPQVDHELRADRTPRADRAPLDRPPRAEAPRAAAAADRAAAMRRAIAELMARSKREIPHYYLSATVDLAAAEAWLRRRNRGRPPSDRLVPAALLLKAAAVAARDVPQLNGFWENDAFTPGTGVHLGVAVSLRDGGLLMPVIHDADTLTPEDLMAALKDLVRRARLGRLRGSELSGATLTVTNLGDQGVESVLGVIYPPQVALVGFGAVVERPWAADGMLGVRPVVTATLSADHRATDGAVGARYLTAVDRLLQKPEEL